LKHSNEFQRQFRHLNDKRRSKIMKKTIPIDLLNCYYIWYQITALTPPLCWIQKVSIHVKLCQQILRDGTRISF